MVVQMDILSLIAEGERLRTEGLNLAVQNAGPGWADKAYQAFKEWLFTKPVGYKFLTEDFRIHAQIFRLVDEPKSRRAFGFICPKAKKEGLIEWAGVDRTKDKSSHRTPANQWRKV